MSEHVHVDTSAFIEYLHGSSSDLLALLILNNRVILSPVVRLELLAGVRKTELAVLERMLNALQPISDFASLSLCQDLLRKARGSGVFGGLSDLMIIADAVRTETRLLT